MQIKILHEIKGRIRFSSLRNRFTIEEADLLLNYLYSIDSVVSAKVYERTGDGVVWFFG